MIYIQALPIPAPFFISDVLGMKKGHMQFLLKLYVLVGG